MADYNYSTATVQTLSKVMQGVYLRMCGGLLATALVAFFVASTPEIMMAVFSSQLTFWGLVIAEFALVIGISAAINKISAAVATLLFYAYAVVNGVLLSSIFVVYDLGSIGQTFLISAGVFGAMSAYGYLTKADLSRMGTLLFMGLIGVLVAIVVNMFMHSSGLQTIISVAVVAIFIGLTAWDTQKIKQWVIQDGGYNTGKIATLGALELYLDFINLFLYLLRFFGSRND